MATITLATNDAFSPQAPRSVREVKLVSTYDDAVSPVASPYYNDARDVIVVTHAHVDTTP